MELSAFDRETLAVFVQYMPFEDPVQFAAVRILEGGGKIGRDALNASVSRLCAARLLVYSGGRLYAADEVKLAARGRYWRENWKDGFFTELSALAPAESAAEAPAELFGEHDFEAAARYARGAKRFMARRGGHTPRAKKINAALCFFCLLLLSALVAAIAVVSAVSGDYDNAFAAFASFIFFPGAVINLALWRQAAKEEKHGAEKSETSPLSRGKGYKAAVLVSCGLHAAFFAALIPFARFCAAGLGFVLAVTGLGIWLYFFVKRRNGAGQGDVKPRGVRKTSPLKPKTYFGKPGAFTRCSEYYMDGVNVLSTENQTPAEPGPAVTLDVFGHKKETDVYKITGKTREFYVAVAVHKGVTFIGFPRRRDLFAVYGGSRQKQEEDSEKNTALERELLMAYAAEERAKEENAVFFHSEDGLLRGFVCIQGEFYCARMSAPFFRLPDEPPQEELERESGAEFIPREETEGEAFSWETLIEELFEKKENAEKFLRAMLSETDTESLYKIMNP